MTRRRVVAGGGVAVEVPPDRLVGWVNRFAGRNGGLCTVSTDGAAVTLTGGDGTLAILEVPFGPMPIGDREPVDALLAHLDRLGALGVVLARGGAHSIGVVRAGVVLSSSTDRAYLQGRTAAGGWSQQRFARRRENQRSASYDSAAGTAARILAPVASSLHGVVLGGDRRGLADVLADPRLDFLSELPTRTFADIGEPRRAVLDEIASRSHSVEITVRAPG
ncbi:MAG TPA: acVLRF1 family peptidyl-tRNA hydrolase [Nakamurella sp.]